MELTIDSMFIFALLVIGVALMITSHLTRIRIFSIFATGFFIALMIILSSNLALLIPLIGMTIFEWWYAFFGGAD